MDPQDRRGGTVHHQFSQPSRTHDATVNEVALGTEAAVSAARTSVVDLIDQAEASDDPALQRLAARVRSRLAAVHLAPVSHRQRSSREVGDYVDVGPIVRECATHLLLPVRLRCPDEPLMVRGRADDLRHGLMTAFTTLEGAQSLHPISIDVQVVTGRGDIGDVAARVDLVATIPAGRLGPKAVSRAVSALGATLSDQHSTSMRLAGSSIRAVSPGLEVVVTPDAVSIHVSWPVDLG